MAEQVNHKLSFHCLLRVFLFGHKISLIKFDGKCSLTQVFGGVKKIHAAYLTLIGNLKRLLKNS